MKLENNIIGILFATTLAISPSFGNEIDEQIANYLPQPQILPYPDRDIGFPITCKLLGVKYHQKDEQDQRACDKVRRLIEYRLAKAKKSGRKLSPRAEVLAVLNEGDKRQSDEVLRNRAKIIDRSISAIYGMDPRNSAAEQIKYFQMDE